MENNKRIIIKKGLVRDIDLSSYLDYDSISIILSQDSVSNIKLAILDKLNKDIRIKIVLKENANANIYFADFAPSNHKVIGLVKLEEEHANAIWKTSCLSKEKEEKLYDISFIHEAKNTTSKMENYGVATNASSLKFKGVSHIQQTANKSSASQEAKIIVFDDEVNASSSPSLRIDNNDINASHSAIVGRLNEEHLYYLMSRGLTEDESRRLITFGYLSPISNYFDKETKDKIIEKISGRF